MKRKTISPKVPTSTVLIGRLVDFESPFLFLESKVAKTNNKQQKLQLWPSMDEKSQAGLHWRPLTFGSELLLGPRRLQGHLERQRLLSCCLSSGLPHWNVTVLLPQSSFTPFPAPRAVFLKQCFKNQLQLHPNHLDSWNIQVADPYTPFLRPQPSKWVHSSTPPVQSD